MSLNLSKSFQICQKQSFVTSVSLRFSVFPLCLIVISHLLFFFRFLRLFLLYLQLRKPRRRHSCPGPVVHESFLATSLLSWSKKAVGPSQGPCSSDRKIERQLLQTCNNKVMCLHVDLQSVVCLQQNKQLQLKYLKASGNNKPWRRFFLGQLDPLSPVSVSDVQIRQEPHHGPQHELVASSCNIHVKSNALIYPS